MKRIAVLVAAAAFGAAGVTAAADTASTKPSTATTKAAKPSAQGPGTQTEDELYIGSKAQAKSDARFYRRRAKDDGACVDPKDPSCEASVQRNQVQSK